MDTNDKVLLRLNQIRSYLKNKKPSPTFDELDAWALTVLGLTNRTMAKYLRALETQEVIEIDREKKVIIWL